MYIKKRSGPMADPWGTPDDMCLEFDNFPETETCWDLWSK